MWETRAVAELARVQAFCPPFPEFSRIRLRYREVSGYLPATLKYVDVHIINDLFWLRQAKRWGKVLANLMMRDFCINYA